MNDQVEVSVSPKNENRRKLASVQIIISIEPHLNADKLELATILGWQVVINKQENLKVLEKVIYFEIDSILPEEEWSKFMEKCKYRVKTIKLRGELSQGLIIPISNIFPNSDRIFNEGDDLTQILKVIKYDDEEINKAGNPSDTSKDKFPEEYGVTKTEEPRIQSSPKLLNLFSGKSYIATLKYDGTSSTFIYDDKNNEFIVCSRNFKVKYSKDDIYWRTAIEMNIQDILKKNPDYIIQGEIYGPKINGNRHKINVIKLAVFNLYSKSKNKGLDYFEMVDLNWTSLN